MLMKIDHNLNEEKSEKNNNEKVIKQIKVSDKRQITIPKRFYDKLGVDQEVICELRGNEIVLRGVPQTEDLSEEILEDLVAQGFEGKSLVREFQKKKSQVRPAVEKLIAESSLAARNLQENGNAETEELFGDLKE